MYKCDKDSNKQYYKIYFAWTVCIFDQHMTDKLRYSLYLWHRLVSGFDCFRNGCCQGDFWCWLPPFHLLCCLLGFFNHCCPCQRPHTPHWTLSAEEYNIQAWNSLLTYRPLEFYIIICNQYIQSPCLWPGVKPWYLRGRLNMPVNIWFNWLP